jgi:tetratricopeptide (TPR) repeat protein
VGVALLLKFYNDLPERKSGEKTAAWGKRLRAALEKFKHTVEARYTEGTLQRLLDATAPETRRAAVLALGLLGTMASNEPLATMLHDEDPAVRRLTADALWSLWFRGDTPQNSQELQRLIQLSSTEESDLQQVLAGLNALLQKAPQFAEAYNQRAILYFRLGEYQKSAEDCEAVLKLNPHHFGAAGGLAQCYVKLGKFRAALKSYRRTFRINPNMEGLQDAIQSLERRLGEEGKK